jgi:murein DD-endopeptidase MepM/ murein hydrolase activator NlpD
MAALAPLVAVVASAPVAARPAQQDDAGPLASAFESLARAARKELSPPRPRAWFPVSGVIDFGESAARFGAWRDGHEHEGQDLFAPAGTPMVAVREGRVVEMGDDGGRGNYVAVWSAAARRTFVYLHMRAPTARRLGEQVDAGAGLGAVGCTGSCWGDHLHLEMRHGRGTTGSPLDPLPLLRRLAHRAR